MPFCRKGFDKEMLDRLRWKRRALALPLVRAVHKGLAAFRYEYRKAASRSGNDVHLRITPRDVGPGPELPFDCLIATDRGLFRLSGGRIHRLTGIGGYGVAQAEGRVFLSLNFPGRSSLVSFDAGSLGSSRARVEAPVHWSLALSGNAERIHQVTSRRGGPVWGANTGRNTLLRVEPDDPDCVREFAVFHDAFGKPILYDHNHINSVVQYGETLLFTAYQAGDNSLVGVVDGDRVTGFAYPRTGIHDIYLTAEGFLLCDTFGENVPGKGGFPFTENGVIDPDFFTRPPGCVVRGAVTWEGGMLLGHSHKGERSKRFTGRGSLIRVCDGRVQDTWEMPAAQIYQIIRTDGDFGDNVPERTPGEVRAMFEEALGPAVYEGQMREVG